MFVGTRESAGCRRRDTRTRLFPAIAGKSAWRRATTSSSSEALELELRWLFQAARLASLAGGTVRDSIAFCQCDQLLREMP